MTPKVVKVRHVHDFTVNIRFANGIGIQRGTTSRKNRWTLTAKRAHARRSRPVALLHLAVFEFFYADLSSFLVP